MLINVDEIIFHDNLFGEFLFVMSSATGKYEKSRK